MWAGEVNYKYLAQQPSILTSKLHVVSVSFIFRAVSVRSFLNTRFIKYSKDLFLLDAVFISCCLLNFLFNFFVVDFFLSFFFLSFIYSKVYPVRAFDVANVEQLYYTSSDCG